MRRSLAEIRRDKSTPFKDPDYYKELEKEEKEAEVEAAKSATSSVSVSENGVETVGYKYANAPIADIIAYICGNEEGEKKLQQVKKDADQILDPEEKRSFLESALQGLAAETDGQIGKMLGGFLQECSSKKMGSTEADLKEQAFAAVKKMGLNVDPSNLDTSYDDGPPQTFTMVFVNRPHKDVADKDSTRSQLAESYGNTLSGKEKENFDARWNDHVENAKSGGPKMPAQEFQKEVDRIKQDIKDRVSKSKEEIIKNTPKEVLKEKALAALAAKMAGGGLKGVSSFGDAGQDGISATRASAGQKQVASQAR